MKMFRAQNDPITMKKRAIGLKLTAIVLTVSLAWPIYPVRALLFSEPAPAGSVESTETLSVTARVDGDELEAAEAPAASVLNAAIEGELPEGSTVAYQWQLSYTPPTSSEVESDVTSTPPATSEVASDVTSTLPTTSETASDVTSTPPATSEVASDVASTLPATSEVASNVARTLPTTSEVASDAARALPTTSEVASDTASTPPTTSEAASVIASTPPTTSEVASNAASTPPVSSEVASDVTSAPPISSEVASDITSSSPVSSEPENIDGTVEAAGEWFDIPEATNSTYTLTPNEEGCYVRCAVAVTPPQSKLRTAAVEDKQMFSNAVLVLAPVSAETRGAEKIYVGSGGNDGNNGFTVGTQVKTLNAAITKVNSGGIIVVTSNIDCAAMVVKKNFTVQGESTTTQPIIYLNGRLDIGSDSYTSLTFKNVILDGKNYTQDHALISMNIAHVIFDNTTLQNAKSICGAVNLVKWGSFRMQNNSEIIDCANTGVPGTTYVGKWKCGLGVVTIFAEGYMVMDRGSKISGCKTRGPASAVYIGGGQLLDLGIDIKIQDNTTTAANSGAVYLASSSSKMNIGYSTLITGNTSGNDNGVGNVYLSSGAKIVLKDNFTNAARIGVSSAVTADNTLIATILQPPAISVDYPSCVLMDDNTLSLKRDGSNLRVKNLLSLNDVYVKTGATGGDGTKENPLATLRDAYVVANNNASIHVMGDFKVKGSAPFNGNKNITLKGSDADTPSTITREGGYLGNILDVTAGTVTLNNIIMDGGGTTDDATGALLKVSAVAKVTLGNGTNLCNNTNSGVQVLGGYLTMKDDSTITDNKATSGGGVIITGGIFTINGGTITANTAANGAGIYQSGGTVTVNSGGIITKNTATNNGGGVIITDGTFTISAGTGTVTANTASNNGGGIYQAGGIVNLQGGSITENNATGTGSVGDGIYVNGELNVSGNAKVARGTDPEGEDYDNIFLAPGKLINVAGTLTGVNGELGVNISDRPQKNKSRVFATTTLSDISAYAAKFSLDNPIDDPDTGDPFDPSPAIRAEGANLAYTFYSRDARLSVLERNAFTVAGEVAAIPAGGFLGNSDTSDNTTKENVTMEIPYSVNTKTTIDVTAVTNDSFAKIVVSDLPSSNRANEPPVYAPSNRVNIPVPYDPETLGAGGKFKFTITVTSQYGAPSKVYNVTVERGMPTISGNDTATFNFDKGGKPEELKDHFIVIDKLRGSTIETKNFTIRAESAVAADIAVKGVEVVGFDNQTGKVQMQMTKAYALANTADASLGVKAGKQSLSLWVESGEKSYNLGKFVVNMTVVNKDMLAAFVEISHLDWGAVYPKNAYIRAEDKPKGVNAWPSDGKNLIEEDEYGDWGKIVNGEFEVFESDEDQSAWIEKNLKEYVSAMVKAKITELAKKYNITLPNYNIDIVQSDYQPAAVNASSALPSGTHGKYTFRVDLEILKDDGTSAGVKVAGQQHYVTVIPREFDGIPEEKLYNLLQNEEKTGALDGTLSGSIWVNEGADEDTVFAAIKDEFLKKDGSEIKRRLEWLKDKPEYQGYTFEPYFGTEMVEADGPHFLISLIIRAYKTDCPKYDDDGSLTDKTPGAPKPMYISEAAVDISLNVEVRHNMTVPQLLAAKAVEDIRTAIVGGQLLLADVNIGSEAAAKKYVSDKILSGVTTPKGETLTSTVGKVIFYPLEKPLKDMITITVGRREVDTSGAYMSAINGTPGNPYGRRGHYGFKIDITAEVDGNAVGNNKKFTATLPLDFSGSPVKAVSDGGSDMDDGIVLLPAYYYNSGGSGGGNQTTSSETSSDSVKPVVAPTPTTASEASSSPKREKPTPTKPKESSAPESGSVTIPPQSGSKPEVGSGGGMLSEKENVKISVVPSKNLAAKFADLDAVLKAVLTPEELKAVQAGEKVEVELRITDIGNAEVSPDEKKLIKERASEDKLELGMFVDILMQKRIGDSEWVNITEMDSSILVEMAIPDSLHHEGRVFSMAHNHGGKVNIYPNISTAQNTLAFETDRFSTFAIVYKDIAASKNWIIYWIIGLLVAGAIVALIVFRFKKRRPTS